MSSPARDRELEVYFNHGLDFKNRRLFLFGDIEEDVIGHTIKSLYYLERINHDPIELYVSSLGGSEYEMFALYDVFNTIQSPIHTVAIGKCMSAAPLIVAAGVRGERYAMPNAWFMIHQGTIDGENGRIESAADTISHYKKINDKWYQAMAQHTNKTKQWWERVCKKVGDSYFSADEAIDLGIVDHIWMEKDQ